MANIESAKKRARQAVRRTAHNRFHIARMRTAIKRALQEQDPEVKAKLLQQAQSFIARTAKRGVIAQGKAKRMTSRLFARTKPST